MTMYKPGSRMVAWKERVRRRRDIQGCWSINHNSNRSIMATRTAARMRALVGLCRSWQTQDQCNSSSRTRKPENGDDMLERAVVTTMGCVLGMLASDAIMMTTN